MTESPPTNHDPPGAPGSPAAPALTKRRQLRRRCARPARAAAARRSAAMRALRKQIARLPRPRRVPWSSRAARRPGTRHRPCGIGRRPKLGGAPRRAPRRTCSRTSRGPGSEGRARLQSHPIIRCIAVIALREPISEPPVQNLERKLPDTIWRRRVLDHPRHRPSDRLLGHHPPPFADVYWFPS
jgi:hypothetical protein